MLTSSVIKLFALVSDLLSMLTPQVLDNKNDSTFSLFCLDQILWISEKYDKKFRQEANGPLRSTEKTLEKKI